MERIKKDKEEGEGEEGEKRGEKKKEVCELLRVTRMRRRCRGNGRGESVLHIDEFTTPGRTRPCRSTSSSFFLFSSFLSFFLVRFPRREEVSTPERWFMISTKSRCRPSSFSVLRIGQSAPSMQFHPSILDLLLQEKREREI